MQDWKMLISDQFHGQLLVTNPSFVPRVGDHVDMGYAPAPTVQEVLISYDKKQIAVLCQ